MFARKSFITPDTPVITSLTQGLFFAIISFRIIVRREVIMKTKTIHVNTYELTDTGFKYIESKDEEYPDDGRHSDLCLICGSEIYPDCREWCQS